jgi:YidC/Oxa1 family membrane protein insertase
MDRNTILRWVLIAGVIILVWKFLPRLWGGGGDAHQQFIEETYVNAPDFAPDAMDPSIQRAPDAPPYAEAQTCAITGARFDAELSTRGAALTHFWIRDAQYATGDAGFDMSTTPDHERWRSLRTLFRAKDADDQLKYDRFVWKLDQPGDGRSCTFTYADDGVQITKVVSVGARDFELEVKTTVKNLASAPKKHRFAIGMFAFRKNSEVKGKLGRVSPFTADLGCGGKDVSHKARDDFKDGWFDGGKVDRYAAVSNYYFAQALVPQDGQPACALLAEDWYAANQARDDDDAAAVYHATLTYETRTLDPGSSTTYQQTAFLGPKERNLLKGAAGKDLGDLVNLGFFSPVAKVLTWLLVFIKTNVTHNWGLAIIAMTLALRTALFPLTWKSIKSSMHMRKLKPEIDSINSKFEGDMQAKQLAMMELWKKHGYGPLGPAGAGCLPQLVQMPVWFAMYTTLQTAVEMYHTKFLWFSDLSSPDKWFILPVMLVGLMILQQRMIPQQPGMDPMQQKMMMWVLPGVFGVMMLFLPAALGVYMMTNSLLGIAQQVVTNRITPPPAAPTKGEIVVKQSGGKGSSALGKGKARV